MISINFSCGNLVNVKPGVSSSDEQTMQVWKIRHKNYMYIAEKLENIQLSWLQTKTTWLKSLYIQDNLKEILKLAQGGLNRLKSSRLDIEQCYIVLYCCTTI